MSFRVIEARDTKSWRDVLSRFERVDVCQLPEYHMAYEMRIEGSRAVLWHYQDESHSFAYPFLLSSIFLGNSDTGYKDISSIYGYSGPLSSTSDQSFLIKAWRIFDEWAATEKVIAEFTRFSPHAATRSFAHSNTKIEQNRVIAISDLPDNKDIMMAALDSKTRNMIRKAQSAGLVAREMDLNEGTPAFRTLYEETMDRNRAPDFFLYDDRYYDCLLSIPDNGLRLFGVFDGARMVSAAFSLSHKEGALYHLGAGLLDYAKLGAGNLCLYAMSQGLIEQGVRFLNLGGGRTMALDDPLLRFKKSNGTGVADYYIGKRVTDADGYKAVENIWKNLYDKDADFTKLMFYR